MRDDDNNLVYEEKSLGSNTLSYTSYARRTRFIFGRTYNYDPLFGKHGLEHSFYTTSGIIR